MLLTKVESDKYLRGFNFFCKDFYWALVGDKLMYMSKPLNEGDGLRGMDSEVVFYIHSGTLHWSGKFFDKNIGRYVDDSPSKYRYFIRSFCNDFLTSENGKELNFNVKDCKKSSKSKFLWYIYKMV